MPVTRIVARPMLAAMFVAGGLDALQNPESKAPAAENLAPSVAGRFGLPDDTVTLVKVNGALQVGAGAFLALGWAPRLAALALAGSLVPTTLAAHRYWEETDPAARTNHRIHFLKNLSMLGGLIIAAADTEGRPSLGWRARKAAQRAGEALPIGH